jgi:hypothetical protein
MADLLKQSSTAQPLVFLMIDSTDHVSAKTGLSPTVVLSKSGAAFGAVAGAVTEIANGWYKVAGNATDTNTLGPLILHASATGADPSDHEYNVVAFDPQDAVRSGLTALPNAAANAAGGLPISTAGALDMDDMAADVDAIETRATLALPAVAPNGAGGLLITAAGSLDMDDLGADVDAIETRVTLALPAAAPQAAGGLITSTAGSLDLDEMNVDIEAIQLKTDNLPASPAAVGSAMTLSNAGIDAVLDRTDGVETAITVRQALRVILAAAALKCDGAAGTTMHFRDLADSLNRITATVDSSGNRTAITLDLT